ncbi:MAG: transcription initiation factor IIB [Zestosphaera tikiterensis]|uniref:Transcription initiation factor IIB n=1 Tax=Zestosphaera tikiterensis TaxID=1973259 RepID=A0A2R7Y6S6_9CREN|nr:MAG: transcription initiation factor IIB [Zestosphaera tikiterensis]
MGEIVREEKKDVESESKCPQDKIIYDEVRGEYICTETGEVIEDKVVDQGPEWRAFTPEERDKRARSGSPLSPTIHDSGIATMIDWRDRDASGKKLEFQRRLEVMRMRKWQIRTRIQDSIDRNITQAATELERITEQLGLPKNIKEEAAAIYRRAVEKGVVRGRAVESVVAAALYAACRIYKIPRTLDEIVEYTKAPKKDVARCFRLLVRELGLKIPVSGAADYVPRIVSALGLGGKIEAKAIEILEEARKKGVTAGKDPAGLAAAAVYIAAQLHGERKTQKDIAQVIGVTEVTVRNRYKEITQYLNIQVPEEE